MKIWDKLTIISAVAVTLFNPLTGQYVLIGITRLLDMAMVYGPYVIAAPATYLLGYGIYRLDKANLIHETYRPSKAK